MKDRQVGRTAHSFDGDGVLFWRIPFQKSALPFVGTRDISSLYSPPKELAFAHLGTVQSPLKIAELPSYLLHRIRGVMPKSADAVFKAFANEDHVVLNTGRPNREPWVNLTEDTLERAGIIGCFNDFYYKPEGFNSRDSKMSRVDLLTRNNKYVRHYDDNPGDAVPMAAAFPEVEVILVKDFSTMRLLSRLEWDRFPNLHVARNLLEATEGTYIDSQFTTTR